ncbi:MAG: substrate-binding domain-containing protein, partial [Leptolinea sp.]|nr:substrate-binding domain-containing protein [Leptolinea sp.]
VVNFEEGYKLTKLLLEKQHNIDGIFYTADILALGALKALSENGINVPEHIKVIGFDDISASAYSTPPLTTIHQSVDKIADLAVKKLTSMMDEEEIDKFIYNIPVSLVERGSA